jgi:hypothetical protein
MSAIGASRFWETRIRSCRSFTGGEQPLITRYGLDLSEQSARLPAG